MCRDCYLCYGAPAIVNDRTKSAAQLIGRVYDFSPGGGNAHVVVDDWNLEDDYIESCLAHCSGFDDPAQAALEALKMLTLSERASALALYEGYLTEGDSEK